MAKKLVYNYTFNASAGTVKIRGNYTLRTLILITNVTAGVIIYNFADPGAGATIAYSAANDETTITLEYGTGSMSNNDELQILVDEQDADINPGESIIDPVHKMRVSTPENLIDTDFEYGLQPTKWETIELVDNIPSVYTSASGVSIGGIIDVTTLSGSNIITVNTSIAHDLSTGDPIEVQGTTSRTANGKYLVTSIPSTTQFRYRASGNQATTANIKTAYTTIIPGAFFTGSDISFNTSEGIATNNASPSSLSVTTDYSHGLSTSTSLYITNTVGKQKYIISNVQSTAGDGSTSIDPTTDTIFIGENNLFNGQNVIIYPTGGGTYPSLTTGATPNSGADRCNSVYNSVVTAMNSVVASMSKHEKMSMVFNNPSQQAFYCNTDINFTSTKTGFTNYQRLLYGDWNTSSDYVSFFDTFGNFRAEYNTFTANNVTYRSAAGLYTGQPVNMGASYTLSYNNTGLGLPNTLSGYFYQQHTPFVNNTLTDYIVRVCQLESPMNNSNVANMRGYFYSSMANKGVYSTGSNQYFSTQNSPLGLGNNWFYTSAVWHHYGGFLYAGQPGYLSINIKLWNTGWPFGQASGPSSWNSYFINRNIMESLDTSSVRNGCYLVQVLIPYTCNDTNTSTNFGHNYRYGVSGSEYTVSQTVTTICNRIILDNSYASAFSNPSGLSQARAQIYSPNRIQLKSSGGQEYNFSTSGTGSFVVETEQQAGILDNSYNVNSGITSTTFSISATSQVPPREIAITNSDIITYDGQRYIFYNIGGGHGFVNGQRVTFNVVSGTAPTGLTNGGNYYVLLNNDKHFRLASTLNGSNIITDSGSGNFTISCSSISGRASATGTVAASANSALVTGTNTKFLSTYKVGDKFSLVGTGATINSYVENTVDSVITDTSLLLATTAGVTTTGAAHFVDTKINIRADGTFIHRPFDGGVEITAGRSPDSSIVRQTRKYFRYQSGKGIQCSVAINFNPSRPIRLAQGSGTSVTMTTEYPHGLNVGNQVKISGASDAAYNGTFVVGSVTDFTFSYTSASSVTALAPTGFIEYAISGYSNAGIRCGLFDFQNGFFYEYDGQQLYAVRRSSVQQVPGSVLVTKNSNVIFGENTRFFDNLSVNDMIVIRGQSYKVTDIRSQTELHIQPSYRGGGNSGVVMTKTIDTKIPQSQWNLDKADGTGPSGFALDINKIQMVYMDYSWYGAGKIRFGFKDGKGHVKYMHEFIHNNKLNEAYMRSGNIPARYEAFNRGVPTFVPSLFHWGTSVIMDGGFDDDDSYLFTASGNTLTFTNGAASTATTNAASVVTSTSGRGGLIRDYYVRLSFPTADASKFTAGIPLYTADNALSGQTVAYTQTASGAFYVFIFIGSGYTQPAVYPSVAASVAVSIGAPSAGTVNVDLNTDFPIISIRLAPSVDNNLIGNLGERDIINRMQLKLQSLGITNTHDCTIKVILNGNLSNLNYQNVGTPSLSQYVAHTAGDTISEGTTIYSFRSSGGSTDSSGKRFSVTNNFDLSQLIDLGNSILGGNGVFPNGPDIITITARVINTQEVSGTSSFQISPRISWKESQA